MRDAEGDLTRSGADRDVIRRKRLAVGAKDQPALIADVQMLAEQINRLWQFIMEEIPGHAGDRDGAIETAISIMRAQVRATSAPATSAPATGADSESESDPHHHKAVRRCR